METGTKKREGDRPAAVALLGPAGDNTVMPSESSLKAIREIRGKS
jgi:hypothetical protein